MSPGGGQPQSCANMKKSCLRWLTKEFALHTDLSNVSQTVGRDPLVDCDPLCRESHNNAQTCPIPWRLISGHACLQPPPLASEHLPDTTESTKSKLDVASVSSGCHSAARRGGVGHRAVWYGRSL